MKPADDPTPSLRERYDAATDGDASAAGYKLDIAPKSKPEKDGDENGEELSAELSPTESKGLVWSAVATVIVTAALLVIPTTLLWLRMLTAPTRMS